MEYVRQPALQSYLETISEHNARKGEDMDRPGSSAVPLSAPSTGSGTANGRFGFEVALVGRGGSASNSGVRPGINRVTTF